MQGSLEFLEKANSSPRWKDTSAFEEQKEIHYNVKHDCHNIRKYSTSI
jgi:hypothetical protein